VGASDDDDDDCELRHAGACRPEPSVGLKLHLPWRRPLSVCSPRQVGGGIPGTTPLTVAAGNQTIRQGTQKGPTTAGRSKHDTVPVTASSLSHSLPATSFITLFMFMLESETITGFAHPYRGPRQCQQGRLCCCGGVSRASVSPASVSRASVSEEV
jgi:hypothetical protein